MGITYKVQFKPQQYNISGWSRITNTNAGSLFYDGNKKALALGGKLLGPANFYHQYSWKIYWEGSGQEFMEDKMELINETGNEK